MVGGIEMGSIADSAVSANVLPYISFAYKASCLKCNVQYIQKQYI